jgi:equilibrative nucleoside transporter 1/2/3
VNSDVFYLVVVQFGFGVTNGWVGSRSMVTANQWVEKEEREAAGAFMATCLVVGLSVGSLLSFLVDKS